jgi:uncharacterized membrane protein HdeD (DUF308 family)
MPQDPWADWWTAEGTGADERADTALREAFTAVPRRPVTAALHERLIEITGRSRVQPSRPWSERWVAAGLVLGALALTVAPLTVLAGFVLVGPARLLTSVVRVCVWLSEWMNAGASIWALLARTGGAVEYAVVTPAGSSFLTVSLIVASMALVVLNRYLSVERS